MDQRGLIINIYNAVVAIDSGRKGFATRGKEQEGRLSYENGIAEALTAFKEAQATANPQAMILAEYTFITQELELCPKTDKNAINSLTKAIQLFDDAFLALQVVENSVFYKEAEKTHPHTNEYRIKGYPKDSYHIACNSHKVRIKNFLSTPGIDPLEKDLLQQRQANLSTAQNAYIEKQKKALDE